MEEAGTGGVTNGDLSLVIGKISRFCAFRERCRQEVLQKMNELEVPGEMTGPVIKFLEENNFINEVRFAGMFVTGKLRQNKWGRVKIRHELKTRAISDEITRDALEAIDPEEYLDILRELILKKRKEIKTGKNLNIREKIITFVTGKGFEFDLVARELKELKI